MREQFLIGLLTLALTLGFIFFIEGLAQNTRPTSQSCTKGIVEYCPGEEQSPESFSKCWAKQSERLIEACGARSLSQGL